MREGKNRHSGFDIQLSGAVGSGKSSAGLLTAMTCMAQGVPVVYMPSGSEWALAAQYSLGDKFFLRKLLAQNADLIAADPALRSAVAPALLRSQLCWTSMITAAPELLLTASTALSWRRCGRRCRCGPGLRSELLWTGRKLCPSGCTVSRSASEKLRRAVLRFFL